MGVKLLNTFLREKFPRTIEKKQWKHFTKKKIVIDTNNYIYKFMSEENLLESFIRMCEMFKYYSIKPLFVFDGKAPKEKYEEIKSRIIERNRCNKLYNNIKNNLTEKEKIEMKRKMVKVTVKETTLVKEIINSYGMKHITSPSESDILCCKLVNNGKVYACLSEDMDMFLYGCKRVIRSYNNENNFINFYQLEKILSNLNLNLTTFKYLSILGNIKKMPKDINIFYYYNVIMNNKDYINHLLNNCVLTNDQIEEVNKKILNYDLTNSNILLKCSYILINTRSVDKENIYKLKQMRKKCLSFFPT